MIILLTIFYSTSYLKADEVLELGKQIFYNEQACINCHILNSDDGGQNKLSKEHVINIVTNGYGVMPAYKDILTKKQINAVATFINKESNNWKNKLSSFVQ